jgi:4-hydroxy-tetrahydrodipicolinate synthase
VIEGIHTALITPMKNDNIDLDALGRIVDRQMAAGVQGLVICATTGEGSTLREKERAQVIEAVVKRAGSKLHITVGTGRVSTWSTIEDTRVAADLGADAALVVAPPYVRPSQEGMVAHFEQVANQGGLPIIVYNVPSRTSCDLQAETIGKLAQHDKIVGVKEATGSILRAQEIIALVEGKIAVLSGDDPITVSLLLAGGQGVISTASNSVPEIWVSLWNAWKKGDYKEAAVIQARLRLLHEALFCEANPGPVKGTLYLLGLIEPEIRLPLIWPGAQTLERLKGELVELGLEV